MTSKVVKCSRCGRRYRGQTDWNVTYRHGGVVGYLCPADQTAEDYVEAVINEATTDYSEFTNVRPGDPVYQEALALHIQATAQQVLDEFLQGVVKSGQGVEANPFALAGETLRRLAETMGEPREGGTIRDDMADMFREMFEGMGNNE